MLTMPYKRRVLKTYGRHKFRTVKPDIWAKCPAICSSGNESSDFDSPALRIRKPLSTCTNLPKTQWNIPNIKQKRIQRDAKENACVFDTSSSSSSNGSNSPYFRKISKLRKDTVQETPPWVIKGRCNNIKKTKLRNLSVKITPTSFSSEDGKNSQSTPILISDDSQVSSMLQGSNLSVKNSTSVSKEYLNGLETADDSHDSSNQNSSPEETSNISTELVEQKKETPTQPYSTSTPVVSQNSQLALDGGRRHAAASQRKSQNIRSLSDCQVFVKQLQLTPEQYEAARLSLSDADTSIEVFLSNSKSVVSSPELLISSLHGDEHKERQDTSTSILKEEFHEQFDSIEQPDNIIKEKLSTNTRSRANVKQSEVDASLSSESSDLGVAEARSEKNLSSLNDLATTSLVHESDDEDMENPSSTCESQSSNNNYENQLTECVVALKKLQLSPFKVNGRLDKKRLCVRVSLDNSGQLSSRSSLSSIHEEDVGAPVTPPRNQSSYISFVDVMTPHTSLIKEPVDNEVSAFDKLLLECEQEKPITFKEYLKPSCLKKCVKIGEGVYGEVFRTINQYKQPVALKIIPIGGDIEVNGEPQKSCHEILHEIVISKELSELAYYEEEKMSKWSTPNFISVHRVTLIQDKYPAHLIKEWVKWDKKKESENDKPDIFPSDQLFLVFEFANGGTDLENFEFKSMTEALSVLKQVTLSLAIAEASLEFEHRDLHWGNVLIIETNEEEIEYTLDGDTSVIDSCGVHVSIIDFTLSRLRKDGVTVFCNLAEDESLFTGQGDYQFDIYRKMQELNSNEWETFTPATNIQWLHYLADKILNKKFPSRNRAASASLRRFYANILKFQSAKEFVESGDDDFF